MRISNQLNIYKPLGKTAYEMIEILKAKYPEYSNQKISFAGRLDPMAQGVLVLLIGEDENKARRDREKSDKEYTFKMLLGVKSDTYDICGLPEITQEIPTFNRINSELGNFTGKIQQKLPIYSAYQVRGKPMYVHARNQTLKDTDIPIIEREIYKLEISNPNYIDGKQLYQEIKTRIDLITRPDFRQSEILNEYYKKLDGTQKFLIIDGYAHVSSGTYIRSLCNDIALAVNSFGVSLEITRTRSGIYNMSDSIHII